MHLVFLPDRDTLFLWGEDRNLPCRQLRHLIVYRLSVQRGDLTIGKTGGEPPTRISRITSKSWRWYKGMLAGLDDSSASLGR